MIPAFTLMNVIAAAVLAAPAGSAGTSKDYAQHVAQLAPGAQLSASSAYTNQAATEVFVGTAQSTDYHAGHGYQGFVSFVLKAGGLQSEPTYQYNFNQSTIPDAGFTVLDGGFDNNPPGNVALGAMPVDSPFPGATDGRGLIFVVGPGQVQAVLGPVLQTDGKPAVLRAAARSNGNGARITIGALPAQLNQPDSSVAEQTIASSIAFMNAWKRLIALVDPPAPTTQIYPLLQVANLQQVGVITVYIDTLDIFVLEADRQLPTNALGADGTGP